MGEVLVASRTEQARPLSLGQFAQATTYTLSGSEIFLRASKLFAFQQHVSAIALIIIAA